MKFEETLLLVTGVAAFWTGPLPFLLVLALALIPLGRHRVVMGRRENRTWCLAGAAATLAIGGIAETVVRATALSAGYTHFLYTAGVLGGSTLVLPRHLIRTAAWMRPPCLALLCAASVLTSLFPGHAGFIHGAKTGIEFVFSISEPARDALKPRLLRERPDVARYFDGDRFFCPEGWSGDIPLRIKIAFSWEMFHPRRFLQRWHAGTLGRSREIAAAAPPRPFCPPPGGCRVFRIGHATTWMLFPDGISVVTDPVFPGWCGPVPDLLGTPRCCGGAVPAESMPDRVDVVLISHDHYDHLCRASIEHLEKNFSPVYYVPYGVGTAHLIPWGVDAARVHECLWGDQRVFVAGGGRRLELFFFPGMHWSGRGLFDRCRTLWGMWGIRHPKSTVLFAGDTGRDTDVDAVKGALGKIDLALLPIGPCGGGEAMRDWHMNARDALKMHMDLGAARSLGIHHDTFILSDSPGASARMLRETGVDPSEFVVLPDGEFLDISSQ